MCKSQKSRAMEKAQKIENMLLNKSKNRIYSTGKNMKQMLER